MWNSSDRSSWSDPHRSFTTFFYSASRPDWSERELDEKTISKMTLQCCFFFFTVIITLTAFLFHVSPFIYQCNYRAAKKFCWNPLFSPLSTAFSFSKWHYFYIPWLPINSSKRKSLFESQSLSLVLLHIWFILGTHVRLFSAKNCQGIGGLSQVKVPGKNGLSAKFVLRKR